MLCLLGALCGSFLRAADLCDYGAIYDDDSADGIAQNDRAVAKLMAALPADGGGIDLRPGVLHVSQPITYPQRWRIWANVPLNFYCDGTITSRIKMHGSGPAVIIAPEYAAQYVGGTCRLRLQGVTLDGGGLKLEAGGKYTTLRELRITGADVPIDAHGFDGGCLDDVYCYGNRGPARFDSCMLMQCVRAAFRNSDGDGLSIKNSRAWSGQIYCESNKGWQADFDGLRGSSLSMWFEDFPNAPDRKLCRRRNCMHDVLTGSTQHDLVFDDDAISRLLCKTLTAETSFPPIGDVAGTATSVAIYGGKPLLDADGLTIICKPGCFAQAGDRMGELRGIDEPAMHEWKAGDWFQLDFDLTADAASLAWLNGETPLAMWFNDPALKISAALNGKTTHFSMPGQAAADGKWLRLFVFMLPRRSNDIELRFTVSNCLVRHLRGD